VLARPRVLFTVQQGREAAVRAAIPYTPAVLAETGQVGPPTGELIVDRFMAAAPDGRPMGSLIDESVITAKVAVKAGAPVQEALRSAGSRLTRDVLTALADTRRQVFHADLIQRPKVGGYTRMLNPPSCSRCIILAGKWFAWNQGFQRHPRCDCIHIPTSESASGDFRVGPADYFNKLSKAEQDATFTKQGARAIRDGADMNRVENIRLRGLGTVSSNRRYGTPHRMTVDDIYRVAGTRTNAIRLLEQEGYVLPTIFPR